MKNVFEVIKDRRSTRAFKPEQIERADLEQILEAGSWAPSGKGFQGWHFCALHNQEKVSQHSGNCVLFARSSACLVGRFRCGAEYAAGG